MKIENWGDMMRRRCWAVSVVSILVGGTLCAVPMVTAESAPGIERSVSPLTLDDAFYAVSKEVPGFAGAAVDESRGRLLVHLTTPSEKAANSAYGALRARIAEMPTSLRPIPVRANYDFLALKTWYGDFAQEVLTLPDVVSTDIDETQNRLNVGLSNTRSEDGVRQLASKHAVPQGAIIVSQTAPVRPDLQVRFRPLQGGQQIGVQNADPNLVTIC
jgi:hypothetical protein